MCMDASLDGDLDLVSRIIVSYCLYYCVCIPLGIVEWCILFLVALTLTSDLISRVLVSGAFI